MLLAEVNRKSALVFGALNGARGVRSVRGKGLMIGIETDPPSERVMALCAERGVLVTIANGCLRLLPALNIPESLLVRGIGIIKAVLAETK